MTTGVVTSSSFYSSISIFWRGLRLLRVRSATLSAESSFCGFSSSENLPTGVLPSKRIFLVPRIFLIPFVRRLFFSV